MQLSASAKWFQPVFRQEANIEFRGLFAGDPSGLDCAAIFGSTFGSRAGALIQKRDHGCRSELHIFEKPQ